MKNNSTRIAFTLAFCAFGLMAPAQAFKGVALPIEVNTEYDETQPRLSPSDDRLYFVRDRHPENSAGRGGGQDIWVSERQPNGTWGKAKNMGAPLNNNLHNHVGAVTDAGKTLWVGNQYADGQQIPTPGIATSRLENGVWTNPKPELPHPLKGKALGSYSFFYHEKLNVILASYVAAPGSEEDLFVILPSPNGGWKEPKSLGGQVNTTGFETGPFLSLDGNTLFFSSNGRGGAGNGDIFMTRRLDDTWTNWSDPVNLGPEVNTAGFDGHFIMDSQGANGYFVSGPTPSSLGDIYSIPLKDIRAFEPEPLASSDTLRIFTKANTPIPFFLDAYGVPADEATLVSGKSISGRGIVTTSRVQPHFTYTPMSGFVGEEVLKMTYCDPPMSDNCKDIIVLAEVTGDEQPTIPMISMRASTKQDMPVNLNVPESTLRMADMVTTRGYLTPRNGTMKIDYNEGRDQLAYFPPQGFVGKDTVYLYRPCKDSDPSNCRLVQVLMEVLPKDIAVVNTPPVVVDSPKIVVNTPPVVVDTPIVAVNIPPVVEVVQPKDILISGIVTDQKTGQPTEAQIKIFSPNGLPLGNILSNPVTGDYKIRLPYAEGYVLEAEKKYYFPASENLDAGKGGIKGEIKQDFALEPMPMEVGQTFVLRDIYFDLDKSILKPESRVELQRLYKLLSDNPSMEIEVRGHTDNWSSEEYNITLSNNRALAVVNYLKYMGVMGTRMTWKGFGESMPIDTNDTEMGRAMNRRVEFAITKL